MTVRAEIAPPAASAASWTKHWCTAVTVTLAVLLIVVPLAKGGMVESARAILIVAVAVLVLAYCLGRIVNGPALDRADLAWLAPWAVVSGYVALQLFVLPGTGVWLVKPLPGLSDDPLVRRALAAPPMPLETIGWWAIFSAYWAVAWVASQLSHVQLRWLALVITVLALFEALYGMVAFAGGQQTLLGIWPKEYYLADVTGTFVNKNHYAGLLAVSWPLGLGLILMHRREGGFAVPKAVRYASAVFFSMLVGLALLNSHSRLGVVSALVGLAVWGALAIRGRRAERSRVPAWLPWTLLGLALLAGVWFGLAPLIARFLQLPSDTARLNAWASLLALPWQTWLFGAGAGTFEDVFRVVQPYSLQKDWIYAHNDYLELVVELGLVGTLLAAIPTAAWLRSVWPRHIEPLQAGALGGLAAIGVHSLGDFNLQIPGVALVAWACLGAVFSGSVRAMRTGANARRSL